MVVGRSHHFGPTLDLHSGGVDLQFPHHDNEMAQCEAFHHTPLWCGHFVHWEKADEVNKLIVQFIQQQ